MSSQPAMFIKQALEPLMIERAEGPWLYTRDGRKILDAGAGAVVVNIGQGREELARLAADEVRRLNYVIPVWSSPARERLTERLAGWTPSEPETLFLHEWRLRGGGSGDQVRHHVSQDEGASG